MSCGDLERQKVVETLLPQGNIRHESRVPQRNSAAPCCVDGGPARYIAARSKRIFLRRFINLSGLST